jgi:NAD-dependent dihydropyrimidine dehydrogenase PreA subunit
MAQMNRHPDRPRLVAVVTESCTGCHACVDYCLVDCIDAAAPAAAGAPPIQIREEECIGCQVCAKVCDQLALNGIRLVPAEELRATAEVRALAEVA